MANTTSELGSLKLPATSPHRVTAVGATYLDAIETLGPDGKPTIVYVSKLGYRGQRIELNSHEARRLIDLDAVKPADAPLSYDEQTVDALQKLVDERGLTVTGTGADGGVLKSDLLNALENYDRAVDSTDSGVAVAASAPGGVTVSDARSQSGRRA